MISLIVAAANNGVIGAKGGIPWDLPAELAYFKAKTMGHPIIMGRKTYDSIGRVLPGRRNIIISRDPDLKIAGAVVVRSFEDALREAKSAEGSDEIFVIGGQAIFEMALPRAGRIYLTEVDAEIAGDTFFKYDPAQWRLEASEHHPADAENPYAYTYQILERA